MKLYQYAAFYTPSDKNSVELPQIIIEPTAVLAEDEKTIAIIAARTLPEKYMDKLNQVEIIVRPF